ncbi:transmembrane protein 255B [Cebus imitator]|uniref:transmembrane protein 255B n=1 Tax=Cebus imitator TaxID=2715852 RepID=UPI00189C3136|nr:transmembrane protein 255B [Cebus imitator]
MAHPVAPPRAERGPRGDARPPGPPQACPLGSVSQSRPRARVRFPGRPDFQKPGGGRTGREGEVGTGEGGAKRGERVGARGGERGGAGPGTGTVALAPEPGGAQGLGMQPPVPGPLALLDAAEGLARRKKTSLWFVGSLLLVSVLIVTIGLAATTRTENVTVGGYYPGIILGFGSFLGIIGINLVENRRQMCLCLRVGE